MASFLPKWVKAGSQCAMSILRIRAILGSLTVLIAGLLVPIAGVSPAAALAGSSDWKVIAAGGFHTCGIRTNGRLYCWGDNSSGRLGTGDTTARLAPAEVAGGATNWTSVSLGAWFTCARKSTGRLYCWGYNYRGQLGNGTTNESHVPVEVAGGWTNWTTVVAGAFHVCGRRSTGRLYCWGSNNYSQLGDATTTDRLVPTQVAGGWTNWTSVSSGMSQTCGRRSTGRLYCWGSNLAGGVGDGTTTPRLTPTQVAGGWTNWTSVSVGANHACGRRSTGRLYCWGYNGNGAVGDSTNGQRFVPTQVAGAATDWSAVSTGNAHTCARKVSGRLFCWGSGTKGQLGNNQYVDQWAPVEVAGGATDWSLLSLGQEYSCALTKSLRAYCWGYGIGGQLGAGVAEMQRAFPDEVAAG